MPLPLSVGVFFSEKDFRSECKRLGIKENEFTGGGEACVAVVHSYVNDKTGHEINMMCFRLEKMKEKTAAEIVGIVAHECVHVFQNMKNFLGEREPGKEFEAYAIQHLVEGVIEIMHEQPE